jgi:hypothetical protein
MRTWLDEGTCSWRLLEKSDKRYGDIMNGMVDRIYKMMAGRGR